MDVRQLSEFLYPLSYQLGWVIVLKSQRLPAAQAPALHVRLADFAIVAYPAFVATSAE